MEIITVVVVVVVVAVVVVVVVVGVVVVVVVVGRLGQPRDLTFPRLLRSKTDQTGTSEHIGHNHRETSPSPVLILLTARPRSLFGD